MGLGVKGRCFWKVSRKTWSLQLHLCQDTKSLNPPLFFFKIWTREPFFITLFFSLDKVSNQIIQTIFHSFSFQINTYLLSKRSTTFCCSMFFFFCSLFVSFFLFFFFDLFNIFSTCFTLVQIFSRFFSNVYPPQT